eukprot:5804443-Amphidinium_carterae.2
MTQGSQKASSDISVGQKDLCTITILEVYALCNKLLHIFVLCTRSTLLAEYACCRQTSSRFKKMKWKRIRTRSCVYDPTRSRIIASSNA